MMKVLLRNYEDLFSSKGRITLCEHCVEDYLLVPPHIDLSVVLEGFPLADKCELCFPDEG